MDPILKDFPDHFYTERLLIRSPRPGDGQALSEAIVESLHELKPWMPWAHHEITVDGEEQVARRAYAEFYLAQDLMLTLWEKSTDTLIGGSGLHRFDWDIPRFEIGYWLRSSYHGKGYMTEAVRGITHFAFTELSAERVEIRMDDNNIKSWRVAERAGFKHEGTLRRDARARHGSLRDTRIYSMIREEWERAAAVKL